MATAPALGIGVRAVIDASDEALVAVDCSEVTFMDSAGYHVLADATEYAFRRGHTLMIRSPSASCARVLRLCDEHEAADRLRGEPNRYLGERSLRFESRLTHRSTFRGETKTTQ